MRVSEEQIEKLESYFTGRFKELLDGKMLNLQIESHKDANITDIVWSEEQWIYDAVWPSMAQANKEAGWKYEINSAENMQIARYKKGMFYDWHPDGKGDHFSAYKDIGNPKLHNRVRKLSMSIILNDDFEIAYICKRIQRGENVCCEPDN